LTLTEPDSSDSLYEDAAAWVLRAPELGADPEMRAALDAWRATSPAHAQAYADAVAVCDLVADQAAAPELLQRRRDALDRARAAGRRRWGASRPDRRLIAASIAALVAAPIAVLGWRRLNTPEAQIHATGHGEQRTMVLADGSRLSLDALTRVEVTLSRDQRVIELASGRMNIEVAKDPERPLRVRVAGSTVTAMGTVFTVERDPDAVVVTLVEGSVAVRRERASTVQMKPGQELTLAQSGGATLRDHVDTEQAVAWREGKLLFDDEPLAAAAMRMNNYGVRRIVVEGTAQELRISGVFRAGDVEAFVGAVESYFAVDATWDATTVVLRAKAPAAPRAPA
jgi:transmembrane sensor